MTDPTDAEIEAMAEKLWLKFAQEMQAVEFIMLSWADLQDAGRDGADKLANTFRAMARVALSEGRGVSTNLHTTIEAAIHRELRRPASRTMPVSALAGHLASTVLAAIRGAGCEVAREECGDGVRG